MLDFPTSLKSWSKAEDCRNVAPIFQDSTMRATSSEADVEPLVSDTKEGEPYRRPAVEAQLRAVLLLSHSEWMRGLKKYYPETLVRLMRETRLGDPELYGELVAELCHRTVRLARKGARGYSRPAAEEIVD